MIKLTAVIAVLGACVAAGLAQGTIVFNNRISGSIYAPVYLPDGVTKSGNTASGLPAGTAVYNSGFVIGPGYTAELWGGPQGVH